MKGKNEVPYAPAIPGLSFRGFAGESDYPKMIEVLVASKDADGLEEIDTLEAVKRDYANLVNCDKETDMVFVEVDGEVAGYGRVFFENEQDGSRTWYPVGFLKPAWRRKGIGATMLRLLEERIAEIEAARPEGERGPRDVLRAFMPERLEGRIALFRSAGYVPVRYFFEMVRPDLENIPDATLPPGLELRPVEKSQYREIWDAKNEAFAGQWGHPVPSEADYDNWLEFLASDEVDNCAWSVAWDVARDEVAGMVLGFTVPAENEKFRRKRGWTEEISVREAWRGKGLATALIAASLRTLKAAGMTSAALGVDSENESGALRLYEKLGYRVTRRDVAFEKTLRA